MYPRILLLGCVDCDMSMIKNEHWVSQQKKKIKFRSPHSKIEIDFTDYLECQNKGEGKEAVEITSLKALP